MSTYDERLGARIKLVREKSGITQPDLADAIGISYQQLQKYENGTNRITVERMSHIAYALNTNLELFLEAYNGA